MMGAGKMARMALLLLFACAMKRIRAQSESPKGLHMFFSSEGGGRVSIHRPSETPITIPTSELESFHPDKNIFLDAALFAQKVRLIRMGPQRSSVTHTFFNVPR
jgi:hypothetical protein